LHTKHDGRDLHGISNAESQRSSTVPIYIHNLDDLYTIAGRSSMGIALFYEVHLREAEHIHRCEYSERQRILGDGHHETIKAKPTSPRPSTRRVTIHRPRHCIVKHLNSFNSSLSQHTQTLSRHIQTLQPIFTTEVDMKKPTTW
jgi:hypothetical protein